MESSTRKDDFVWPGEPGFKNFPKQLPEDCVEYTIFTVAQTGGSNDSQARNRLKEILDHAKSFNKSLLSGYIWQCEAFSLSLQRSNDRWLLRGRTEFGDSIADEWLIVYLLRELSKKFEDAWIRVWDADGEFLLIEAANALPRWLNPEVADNRVWINKGQLKIIPMDKKSPTKIVDLVQALNSISKRPLDLIHSPLIEEEAFYRIRNYPAQISDSLHTSRVTVPRNLAYILNRLPEHISPATAAFYLRDLISMKPLRTSPPKNLRFPPDDLVTVSVKFTRVGYAQLKAQEFDAPPAWEDTLALSSDKSSETRVEMGMKVSCGFEMLVADPQNQDKRCVREILALLEDIEAGEEALPNDEDMSKWPKDEDDDGWMDVNFEDLEKELAGRGKGSQNNAANAPGGFGDKSAQENLRRIVEQFEKFLNDDSAGVEGAEFSDDMDYDDDEDDGSDVSGEDRDASFDEDEFSDMMRQMMGLQNSGQSTNLGGTQNRIEELESDDDDLNAEEIRKQSQLIEEELREAGALNLDPGGLQETIGQEGRSGEESNRDPKYILAKNLLESLKSQTGSSGPAGNIIGSMGLHLPRNEEKDSH